MSTTTEARKIGVNTGYADGVTCPLCNTAFDVRQYFTVTLGGTSICPDCLDRAEDKNSDVAFRGFVELVQALDDLDMALWQAQDKGADPLTMGNMCMLGRTATDHLATKYMPDLDQIHP